MTYCNHSEFTSNHLSKQSTDTYVRAHNIITVITENTVHLYLFSAI